MLRVKRSRLLRGWSQAELARRARVNATTVSQIESGRFRPYSDQLARIALALDCPVGDAATLLEEVERS